MYFKESANMLLYMFYEEGQKDDMETEKQWVIKLAASHEIDMFRRTKTIIVHPTILVTFP